MQIRAVKPNTWKRIAATLIDSSLFFVIFGLYVMKFGEPNDEGGYTINGLPSLLPELLWFVYVVLTERFFSATLGHMLFGLEVVPLRGSKLTLVKVFKRRLADFVDLGITFGILALVLNRVMPMHQRLGDMWAGTVVIDQNDPLQSTDYLPEELPASIEISKGFTT
jgi:uncharacterized RDD family membrane protein YckC